MWTGLCAAFLCTTSLAAAASDPVLEKAESIVREFTAERRIGVKAFDSGLRVIGLTVNTPDVAEQVAKTFSVQFPEWFAEEQLLGTIQPGKSSQLRLLWKIESNAAPRETPERFSVSLQYRHGYNSYSQVGGPAEISLKAPIHGTVLWTEHRFDVVQDYPPGLYNVLLTRTRDSTVIPLGQVWVTGQYRSVESIKNEISAKYPDGYIVFAGGATLTEWCSLRFPVGELGFVPKTLIVVSTANWLLRETDRTPVAQVELRADESAAESVELQLGRDTGDVLWEMHARGNIGYPRPPVALSRTQDVDGDRFNKHSYEGRFELQGGFAPTEIVVRHVAPKGVVQMQGILLLP